MNINSFFKLFGKDQDNTSYEHLWQKVERDKYDDLPRQTLEDAQKIYDRAQKEKNFPQLLKAWICLTEVRSNLDPDSFSIASIQPLPHEGAVQTAIYNAVMASAYLTMTDTNIADQDADTQSEYRAKAAELFTASLADREVLYAESSLDYTPLITEGADSRLYNHDLLSVLTRFALEHSRMTYSQKAQLTGELSQFYQDKGNREAAVLLRLDQLQYRHMDEDYSQRLLYTDYCNELRGLLAEAKDLEAYADVALVLCQQLNADEQELFCRQFLADCPKSHNRNYFDGTWQNAHRPMLSISLADNILANRAFPVKVTYNNLTQARIEVRRFNGYSDKYNSKPRIDGKLLQERDYELGNDSICLSRRAQELSFSGQYNHDITLPAGHYVIIAHADKQQDVTEVRITSLRLFLFRMPDNKVLALVRDNETGRPVPSAKVRVQTYDGKDAHEYDCDAKGEALFESASSNNRIVAFIPGTDDETPQTIVGSLSDLRQGNTSTQVKLYTDRAIYRPGQTVHVTGFSYSQKEDDTWTNPSRSLDITLYDANYQLVGNQEVTTNTLGSFDTDFVLPQGLLPGRFTVRCDNASLSFRVEEYKRPTFQVEARNTKTGGRTYTFGDTIQIEAQAKTYAGVPVQGAKTHYRIESSTVDFWRWWNASWNKLEEGDVETDDDGIARIPLFLNPHDLNESDGSVVRYRVTFDITDQAGETRSDDYQFSLSRLPFGLQITAPTVIDAANASTTIQVKAVNANNEAVSATGTYYIYKVITDQLLTQGTFHTGQAIVLPQLPAGNYRLYVQAEGNTNIDAEHQFQLFDSRQAADLRSGRTTGQLQPTYFTSEFCQVVSSTFSEESDAEILFSPVMDDVLLGYHILSDSMIIERRQLEAGRHLYRLPIPYRKEYGKGVSVVFYYVRDGQVCDMSRNITYVQPQKQLKLSWSTFRDRLYPGQQEEWVLNITDVNGHPVPKAELMATMYDASLDALSSNYWSFALSFPRNLRHYPHQVTQANSAHYLSIYGIRSSINYPVRSYDQLTQFIHDRWSRRYFDVRDFAGGGPRRMMMSRAKNSDFMGESTAMPMASMNMAVEEEAEDIILYEASASPESSAPESSETEMPAIRSNFAETAFFLPHLLSDADGQVHISFTLPESLTEWKFLGLAHDQQVNYGQISATAIARKDFMVQPNMPRFVREGDHATIAARIINQSEETQEGTVRMRLLDAETEQEVYTAVLPFCVEKDQTTAVTFAFDADDRYPMLICEIVGQCGNTSDGERNFLPVLTSRRYMTEAIPFYVTGKDSAKQIDVHELFNNGSTTATHRRLVLEFTQHPEWTVIEALDGIKLPEHDNAPAFAASLYANTIAAQIARQIPGFEEALRDAVSQNANAAKQSQLDLNDDLRDILLKESPWVIEALNEAEQRARLIDLFDQELMQQRTDKALARLQRLQNSDGSWSWFEGMRGSYYITLSTCESLIGLCSNLDEENATTNTAVEKMVVRALKYLDKEEYEAYRESQKNKYPLHVGEGTLHYLYVCAQMPDRRVSRNISKMREDMLNVLGKSPRDLTILGRSQAACVLRSFGHKKEADKFLQSAIEYTVTKPGMGRYYATDAAYYSWRDYRIPTQLAAMRAIRQSPRADKMQLLTEMQTWLLRQKQTQTWDNPMNTISAIQFLLQSPILSQEEERASQSLPAFTLDGNPVNVTIDTTRFLASQLGYVRTQLPDSVTYGKLSWLEVAPVSSPEAEDERIAWGALYAQYLEDMESLDSHSTGELSISMRLLDSEGREVISDQGIGQLHIGQRVTLRLTIKADRDMDFVQVRCQRPACFEPVEQHSGFSWMNGRGGYVAMNDASTDVFFDRFTRGTTTFDLTFNVDRLGEYLTGIATVQCAYAPEFCAHTAAMRVQVTNK